jgi:hypothetical protein
VRARRAAIGRLIAEGVLKPDKDDRPASKPRNKPIEITDLQLALQFEPEATDEWFEQNFR